MANTETTSNDVLIPFASLNFLVTAENDTDNNLYNSALSIESEIRTIIESLARETFGPGVQLSKLVIKPGSVHINAEIALLLAHKDVVWGLGTATIISSLSRYNALRDSLEQLSEDITTALKKIFDAVQALRSANVKISGAVQPLSGMMALLSETPGLFHDPHLLRLLVGYLILSHAALLGLIAWLLVQHMR